MVKIIVILIAFLVHIELNSVLTLNIELSRLEENLLYSHLKNQTNLKLFYNKLIESNDVDDLTYIRHKITDEDIKQGTIENKCFQSTDDLLNALNITRIDENTNLTRTDVKQLTPTLVHVKFNEGCLKQKGTTKWKHILVGLISVSIINLAALFSAIILPFRKKSAFKWLLTTFIGLAVGTLLGTGIFHLIPMAFSIEDYDKDLTFLTKGLLTTIVIYLFYMRDQIFETFLHIEAPVLQQKNTKSLRENLKTMKPIGWMILLSDLLHGFIDGLTIGAIAIVSISDCLRMMVPIVCEEFSHKLGDAAVLLSSGLPIKQALLMNFLSSCGCYPGFILGAKLGEVENFHPWICALAGGMFVYIGLADMVPELISMGHEIEKDYATANLPITRILKLKILLSQNMGVILGIAIMFLLAKYGEILSQYF
ncbi:unnamed protein product [Rotaria sp. Silwood2]|nr:unnamed protein product [Rotaria sp. Silwood2]CAF4101481.1 unnamed protein product [Rotaria sp. Silwood2]CAF4123764.1 unnamed protein product [Rotaria sp. Silwood2]